MRFRWHATILLPVVMMVMLGVMMTAAQEAPRPVTYDDINTVAGRMFCPECENIPLDKCFTTVCLQWKQDIAAQLATGASADDIIAGFVARFGDQVVGVPQDPFLRNLALIAPTLFLILAIVIGGYTIWSRVGAEKTRANDIIPPTSPSKPAHTSDEKYLAQLQQDIDRE